MLLFSSCCNEMELPQTSIQYSICSLFADLKIECDFSLRGDLKRIYNQTATKIVASN